MALRKYRNSAARTLAAPIANSTTTSMTVDSASGFPTQFPYTLIIDPDGTLEEVVDVTAAVGNILTVVRGVDSTTASAHAAGVRVVHGVSARDFTEANVHVNQTSGAHGANGNLVDTDGAQTVVGQKTFTGGLKTTGGDVIDTATAQPVTGTKTFTDARTLTGGAVLDVNSAQNVTATKTFTADQTFNGKVRLGHADMQPAFASSTADDLTTGTLFVASGNNATAAVGAVFNAPPSGKVLCFLSAYLQQGIDNQTAIASFGINLGPTPGAGTEIIAPSGDRAVSIGGSVTAGNPLRGQWGRPSLITGLTPGTQYNATVKFQTTAGGNCAIFYREIIVLPWF